MKYQYTVKGVDYEVEIQDIEGNIANVTVNGIPFEVEMKQPVKSGKQKVKLSEERRVKSEEFNSSSAPQSAKASSGSPSAWYHQRNQGKSGRQGERRRYRRHSRSHEDAEQHRGRDFRNHHQHRREQRRCRDGRRYVSNH
mgnify:CR=1 FL=1